MKASIRVALVALLCFASLAQAQTLSRAVFLVAKPGMPDPNFRETVVFVVQAEGGGEATGVIVNRPTNRSLAELLPSQRFESFTDPIFFGGPVAQQRSEEHTSELLSLRHLVCRLLLEKKN